ncbi:MAG TPA: 5-oxoprolinase/urea amidolyase family protein, partial [bacterium]|nr:5-oxoprolinase/urea amidolyase family protein [bacterium]
RSAGTVEFVYDPGRDEFYFLEVNTRLQVEHGVTEAVTGIDLVEWMVRLAAGQAIPLDRLPEPQGAAFEARLYAEDPARGFQPSPGTLTEVSFPADVRVDGWVEAGTEVTPHYDALLAKLIVWGPDRAQALAKLRQALDATRLAGLDTNLDYLRQVAGSAFLERGELSTAALAGFAYRPRALEVLRPGTYTTVQDYPGRVGYWDVGVPPSGPMDDYAFRLANRAVGNPSSAAGLECTLEGPRIRFHQDAVAALTGAPAPATLDGRPLGFWEPFEVKAGQVLDLGRAQAGCRTYLAVRGGLDLPLYLGSRSTFVLGGFGGLGGRPLREGDWIPLPRDREGLEAPQAVPGGLVPPYPAEWEIGALDGPHGAPDFFTPRSVEMIFGTAWEVHYNSNRLGIRLKGPKPAWARRDGGEAGLHPSNIHDTEYAVGSLNFTGDMPVILGRDGPSLGGFVCPLTIAKAERWKMGQLKPGDRVRFKRLSFEQALAAQRAQDRAVASLAPARAQAARAPRRRPGGLGGLLAQLPARGSHPAVAYRQAGDECVLIEYGPNRLDLRLRLRVHLLMEALRREPLRAIRELSPGVRSLQVRYDSGVLPQAALLKALLKAERALPSVDGLRVPTRVVHLPMAFEDSATLEAVTRYRRSVRDKAPWLPRNAEFIRRINGLKSVAQVRRILFEARYLVLGLGDVYLGAPCAVPLDPRHRLLTSKYNPARTYTAEGTVGIGGVYMCIYGMDSPGGYQLVGRTLPIWDRFPRAGGGHWLLRFFDQVRFYPVSEAELTVQREAFREGRAALRIEEEVFDLDGYEAFLRRNRPGIEAFRKRQKAAFAREVARWRSSSGVEAPGEPPAPR